jgi:hypothetical protein
MHGQAVWFAWAVAAAELVDLKELLLLGNSPL